MLSRTAIAACTIAACFALPAEARRTVIDSTGQLNLSGYCDDNGDDCTPINLGYSVNFGSGRLTQILIYGNGLLSFGPQVAVFEDYNGSLADYGVPIVSPGINPDVGPDSFGNENFFQSARLTLGAGGVINALWFYCQGPTNCVDNYTLTLTPQVGGYDALLTFPTNPVIRDTGYSIPGVTTEESALLPTRFFIPAIFGAVPEPGTWTMLLAGFGLVGMARRRAAPRAVAA